MIIFIYNNYFIISLFYHFLNFIDLLIREKVIDFFIITFFFFIIFFLFFPPYLFYLSRSPRYNKACVKADKACDNICDNSFHLSYSPRPLRSSRYNEICDKAYIKAYVKVDKTYNDICDKYYYYNKEKFSDINKSNIKAFFFASFISFISFTLFISL